MKANLRKQLDDKQVKLSPFALHMLIFAFCIVASAVRSPSAIAGNVVVWGGITEGQADVPVDLTNAVAIAAGFYHNVALKDDGTVAAWGLNGSGPAMVPPGLSNVVGIGAGGYFSVAVKADGSVVGWGSAPAGLDSLTDVAAVAGGSSHLVALRKDGTVTAVGDNKYYQCSVPSGLSNVVAVAAGDWHSCALRSDGNVTTWGTASDDHQLDAPCTGRGVNVVSCLNHGLVLTADGLVYPWGDEKTSRSLKYSIYPGTALGEAAVIGNGAEVFFATSASGNPTGWGLGEQLNIPAGLSNVVAISAGFYHAVALLGNGSPQLANRHLGLSLLPANTVASSETITLHIAAVGTAPLTYYWLYNGSNFLTTALPRLELTNIQPEQAGIYSVMVSNSLGVVHGSNQVVSVLPLKLTSQPADQSVFETADVRFDVQAVGSALNYQWCFNGTALPGETNAQLSLPMVATNQSGSYSVIVSNLYGFVISSNAQLTVSRPTITYQPADQVVNAADGVTLTVAATGASLSYQWYFEDTPLPGATNPVLSLNSVTLADAGTYQIQVSNAYRVLQSSNAELVVVPLTLAPQPVSQTVYSGGSTTFNLGVQGAGPFSYQWSYQGADLIDATNSSLTLSNLTTGQSGIYSVLVSNSYGSVASSDAVLTVVDSQPNISTQPASQGRYPGGQASFKVVADGSKPLSYQWLFNGTELAGATNSTLILTNLTNAHLGNYSVRVSNGFGSVTSSDAVLTFLNVVTWHSNGPVGDIPLDLTNVVGIAAGALHSVALRSDGRVVVWGGSSVEQTNVPANLSNVVAVAARWYHTLALKSDGTVVSWGDMTPVPVDLSNVVAIAAGGSLDMALRGDGTVAVWGRLSATNVPAGLSNVIAIAAGGENCAALRSDGTVVVWGVSLSTSAFTNIATIAAGEYELVALRANGSVCSSVGKSPNLTNPVAVACSRYSAMILKADGTVTSIEGIPQPANITNIVAITCGENHYLGITGTGSPFLTTRLVDRSVVLGAAVPFYAPAVGAMPLAYQWRFNGTNLPGATNVIFCLDNAAPANAGAYSVVVTNSFGSVTSSVASLSVYDFSTALDSTNLFWTSTGDAAWFMQDNVTEDGVSAMQSGVIGEYQNSTLQTTVTGPGTLTFWWKMEAGADTWLDFCIGDSRQLFLSGSVNWRQETCYLAGGTQTLQWAFSKYSNNAPDGSAWLDQVHFTPGATAPIFSSPPVSQSQAPQLSVKLSSVVGGTPPLTYQWLLNGTNIAGATGTSLTITSLQPATAGIYSLVASNSLGIARTDATVELGQVAAWPTPYSAQTIVPTGMSNVIAIAQGRSHSLVLKADGTVVDWDEISAPAGLTNLIAISSGAGADYDLALRADGTVLAWGDNTRGQLNLPPDLTNVVAIAAGWYHGLALKADGTVAAWGDNGDGETNVPAGLSNVVSIAAGSFHSLAITANGHVVVWGRPGEQINVPGDLTNAVAIAAGQLFCTAATADGRVVTWGDNTYGQANVPASLTNATRLAAGWYRGIAATADGTITACDIFSSVPAGLSNVIAVAAGYYNNLALLDSAPPTAQTPFSNPRMDNGVFLVSIPTQSGRVYRWEYKNTLTDTNWTPLPLVPGNGAIKLMSDPTLTGSQRFYRVRQW